MRLTETEFSEFIEIHFKLLHYARLKYNLVKKNLPVSEFNMLPFQTKLKCRENLNADDNILDDFIDENRNDLSSCDINIINGLRKKNTGNFVILKSLKSYNVFIGKKKIYGVVALRDPLGDLFSEFPIYVRATIFPFRNHLIYDGFIESYSIHFGKNIRATMTREYMEARKMGNIITYY